MSKHSKIETDAIRPTPRVRGAVGALENLAGFVEDMNNQAMERLGDSAALQAAISTRFGPGVSVQDVAEAMEALRSLSEEHN